MVYSGKFLEMETPNLNGHKYTEKMVKKAIKKFNRQKEKFMLGKWHIDGISCAYGTCDSDVQTCNLVDVSHKVIDIRIEGHNAICDIDILQTPQGNMLQGLIDKGFKIAPCIVGTVDWETEKFELIRIDIIPLDRAVWNDCELKKI